jgi:hypothetical protein
MGALLVMRPSPMSSEAKRGLRAKIAREWALEDKVTHCLYRLIT